MVFSYVKRLLIYLSSWSSLLPGHAWFFVIVRRYYKWGMRQEAARATQWRLRKPDLLWCMDTHPIITQEVLCFFFVFLILLLKENVIPIMSFRLTSTHVWLSLSFSLSLVYPFLSARRCSPYVATEARHIQAWLNRPVRWDGGALKRETIIE